MTKEWGTHRVEREKGAMDKKMWMILYFDLVKPERSNLYFSEPKYLQLFCQHKKSNKYRQSPFPGSQFLSGSERRHEEVVSNTNRGSQFQKKRPKKERCQWGMYSKGNWEDSSMQRHRWPPGLCLYWHTLSHSAYLHKTKFGNILWLIHWSQNDYEKQYFSWFKPWTIIYPSGDHPTHGVSFQNIRQNGGYVSKPPCCHTTEWG